MRTSTYFDLENTLRVVERQLAEAKSRYEELAFERRTLKNILSRPRRKIPLDNRTHELYYSTH